MPRQHLLLLLSHPFFFPCLRILLLHSLGMYFRCEAGLLLFNKHLLILLHLLQRLIVLLLSVPWTNNNTTKTRIHRVRSKGGRSRRRRRVERRNLLTQSVLAFVRSVDQEEEQKAAEEQGRIPWRTAAAAGVLFLHSFRPAAAVFQSNSHPPPSPPLKLSILVWDTTNFHTIFFVFSPVTHSFFHRQLLPPLDLFSVPSSSSSSSSSPLSSHRRLLGGASV